MKFCRVLPVLRKVSEFIAVSQVKLLKAAPAHDAVDAPTKVVLIRDAIALPDPLCPHRRIVIVDTPLYTLARIVIAKLMDTYRFLPTRRSDRPVLALRIKAIAVSPLAKFILEFFYRQAERYSIPACSIL